MVESLIHNQLANFANHHRHCQTKRHKDKKTKRQNDKKTKRQKDKKTKRQKDKFWALAISLSMTILTVVNLMTKMFMTTREGRLGRGGEVVGFK